MKITFDVKNQILSRTDRQKVIANSTDYLEAEVTFTEDWDDLEKNMQFVNGDNVITMAIVDSDNTHKITQQQHLNLGIGTWKVSIIGVSGDKRIVTNSANLAVRASGWIGVAGPVPSVYEQLLVIIQSLHTEAASSAVIRSAVQQYIIDNYDALVKEVVLIDDVRDALDDMADDGTLSALMAPLVAAGLPEEVADQISAVVAAQIGSTVASQIDASVASQISTPVNNAVEDYCDENFSEWTGALDRALADPSMAAPADMVGDLNNALTAKYSDLTFPVKSGTFASYNGDIYISVVDIDESENFNVGKWVKADTILKYIQNLNDGVFYETKKQIDWHEEYATSSWPYGLKNGRYNISTGVQDNAGQYMRTVSLKQYNDYDYILLTVPNNRTVMCAEYSASTANADNFIKSYGYQYSAGQTTPTPFGVTLLIPITRNHYYGFSYSYWADANVISLVNTYDETSQEFIADFKLFLIKTSSVKTEVEKKVNLDDFTDIQAKKAIVHHTKDTRVSEQDFDLASGSEKTIDCKTIVRKNVNFVFSGGISSFTSLEVGAVLMNQNGVAYENRTRVKLDGTNLTVYVVDGTDTSVVHETEIAHGLTISDFVTLVIATDATGHADITVECNGQVFNTYQTFEIHRYYYPYVKATNCSISNATLSVAFLDVLAPIWMFGDSYLRYGTNRWPYYLHGTAYEDNFLINNRGGGKSLSEGKESFENLLTLNCPKFAFWCLGMNDNSDSENAPSADWVKGKNAFLSNCDKYGIIPVFATIPSVPSVSHEQKNAWIRSSGYRYVDFATALGAQSDGTWRPGLRENETTGRHPSALGAKVMYYQLLADFPECMNIYH